MGGESQRTHVVLLRLPLGWPLFVPPTCVATCCQVCLLKYGFLSIVNKKTKRECMEICCQQVGSVAWTSRVNGMIGITITAPRDYESIVVWSRIVGLSSAEANKLRVVFTPSAAVFHLWSSQRDPRPLLTELKDTQMLGRQA